MQQHDYKNASVEQLRNMIQQAWMGIKGEGGTIEKLEQDLERFLNGNQTAGTRVRKSFQDIKKSSQDMRLWIQEIKNKKTKK